MDRVRVEGERGIVCVGRGLNRMTVCKGGDVNLLWKNVESHFRSADDAKRGHIFFGNHVE